MSDYTAKIFEQEQRLCSIANDTVDFALKNGADEVEINIGGVTGINISSRDCDLENIEFNRDNGMDITVFCKKKRGSASTTDLSKKAISDCVLSAINIADYADVDKDAGLCDKELQCQNFLDLDLLFDADLDPEFLAAETVNLEKQAVAELPTLIKSSDGASFSASVGTDVLANSQGFCHARSASTFSKSLTLLGESAGAMERGSGYSISRCFDLLESNQTVIKEALDKTLGKLNPHPVPTGEYSIIFTKGAAVSLWQSLVSAIAGSAVYRKSSFLCNKLGEKILPDFVSIKEDPTLKRAFGSANYDNEGVGVKPLQIVGDGELLEYLLSTYSSRKLNMKSNGHSGGIYNWIIDFKENTVSFDDILKEAKQGLVIDSLMGQGVDLVSGNYSRGASGYFFKDGQRQHAVSQITIAGNLKDMFLDMSLMGNDVDPRYKIKTGSILIPKMTVSGT